MKIIRHKTTFQVLYLLENKDECRLDQYGMWGKIRALDIKSDEYEIVKGITKPYIWISGALKYDGSWSTYDQIRYDEGYNEALQSEMEDKCSQIMRIRLEKTYSDTEVQFPDGPGTIQLRNDFDRQNLSDVALGALAIATLQNPNKLMYYRDSNNVTHELRASEMIEIALTVLGIKQEVVKKSWEHKDAVRSLTTIEQVRGYNINTGWPV